MERVTEIVDEDGTVMLNSQCPTGKISIYTFRHMLGLSACPNAITWTLNHNHKPQGKMKYK